MEQQESWIERAIREMDAKGYALVRVNGRWQFASSKSKPEGTAPGVEWCIVSSKTVVTKRSWATAHEALEQAGRNLIELAGAAR